MLVDYSYKMPALFMRNTESLVYKKAFTEIMANTGSSQVQTGTIVSNGNG